MLSVYYTAPTDWAEYILDFLQNIVTCYLIARKSVKYQHFAFSGLECFHGLRVSSLV